MAIFLEIWGPCIIGWMMGKRGMRAIQGFFVRRGKILIWVRGGDKVHWILKWGTRPIISLIRIESITSRISRAEHWAILLSKDNCDWSHIFRAQIQIRKRNETTKISIRVCLRNRRSVGDQWRAYEAIALHGLRIKNKTVLTVQKSFRLRPDFYSLLSPISFFVGVRP